MRSPYEVFISTLRARLLFGLEIMNPRRSFSLIGRSFGTGCLIWILSFGSSKDSLPSRNLGTVFTRLSVMVSLPSGCSGYGLSENDISSWRLRNLDPASYYRISRDTDVMKCISPEFGYSPSLKRYAILYSIWQSGECRSGSL